MGSGGVGGWGAKALSRLKSALLWTGLAQIPVLAALVVIAQFDHTTILGISRWIKPAKFLVSTTIYMWTIAWFLVYLPGGSKLVSWGTALCMVIENALITMQAARGTTSHFNATTPFDAVVFIVMGIVIGVNTGILTYLLVLFFRRPVRIPATYLWGIRFGILLTIVGSLEGVVMVLRLAHTVGLADGGPGMPLTNWSTAGGDLRIAHFFGLHALQVIPAFGYLIRGAKPWGVAVFAGAYAGVIALLFWLAMEGHAIFQT